MFSQFWSKRSTWHNVLIISLLFWLSGSILLDFVIMPSLYASGMMAESGFASASYSIFGVFNRLELVCGAMILTIALANWGFNAASKSAIKSQANQVLAIAGLLFSIAVIYTYGLTPEMSGLGLQLQPFDQIAEVPAAMNRLHVEYWLLEIIKLVAVVAMVRRVGFSSDDEDSPNQLLLG
ncbi:MAG: hypothetical protein ACTS2F_03105 [Thainema sp.]